MKYMPLSSPILPAKFTARVIIKKTPNVPAKTCSKMGWEVISIMIIP
jgi:hypothetical protein